MKKVYTISYDFIGGHKVEVKTTSLFEFTQKLYELQEQPGVILSSVNVSTKEVPV